MMLLMEPDVLASVALLGGSWIAAITWRVWSARRRLAAVAKYEGDTASSSYANAWARSWHAPRDDAAVHRIRDVDATALRDVDCCDETLRLGRE